MDVRAWALAPLVALAACSGEPAPQPGCTRDTECAAGEICQATACLLPARLDCAEGGDEQASLRTEPAPLAFGLVGTEPITRTLTITNEGTCNLVIASAQVEGGANSRFVCTGCITRGFPLKVYPGRDLRLDLTVQAGAPGLLEDRLQISSNDPTRRTWFVDLKAESAGQPDLTVDPLVLDFGYVPVGQVGEALVQAINSSDGSANLEILSAELEPADSPVFTVAPMTLLPITLAPARIDASARAAFTVRYQPAEALAYAATLVITPKDAAPIRVALSSRGDPPRIAVNPTQLDLGSLRLGEAAARPVTIQNTGRSDLVGRIRLAVGAPDLSVPQSSLRIAPGGLFELGVTYEPTRAGSIGDTIIIETNDPAQPTAQVSVQGTAVAAAEQVVSVEMSFDASSDSALDKDIRDVDLVMESPVGLVVRKASPQGAWGSYGAARWSAGPGDNPERVVLGRAMTDGEYVVTVSYVEDCSTLPTALTAAILGIGVDELVGALSEDTIAIDPTQLQSAVTRTCAQRSSTRVTLVTTIDGTLADQREVRLEQKGDLLPSLRLRVVNGRFSVLDP